MSGKSDNKDPRTNIFEILPEVFRSETNESVFENAFNRHLTKDNTERVAGYIGRGNPNALIKRQVQEPTVHRQAHQLQPTAYTKVGKEEYALSFKAFLKQLEVMGVDPDRMQTWGSTLKFNWVPPINLDAFANYQNYYWSDTTVSAPQYLTIENRCNKAQSKVVAYQKVLDQYGSVFPVIEVDAINNTLTIEGLYSGLFAAGFVFYTKNTTNVNLKNKFWTVESSVSSVDAVRCGTTAFGKTVITPVESIAIRSASEPVTSLIGRWWVNTTTNELFAWDGMLWTPAFSAATCTISLDELMSTFVKEVSCICEGDYGWDLALWDDNQAPGTTLWVNQDVNTVANPSGIPFLTAISKPTEAQWIAEWGAPVLLSLWYDTTDDVLKQWDGVVWQIVVSNFSIILPEITGTVFWDYSSACELQVLNQWSEQNKWIHKTQVTNFANIRRARLPIIEYNSTAEMNEWTEISYVWKYRKLTTGSFTATDVKPTRLELEPIKGYFATQIAGEWKLYLFQYNQTINRDVDYTSIFVPGFKFIVTSDSLVKYQFTVKAAEHREMVPGLDPLDVIPLSVPSQQYFVTVITLNESAFNVGVISPTLDPNFVGLNYIAGGVTNYRIEPATTNVGDLWNGYHSHWMLDTTQTTATPSKHRPINPILDREQKDASYVVTTIVPNGILTLGRYFQDLTTQVPGVTTIMLESQLQYVDGFSNSHALKDSGNLRVYLNGLRQYGTYQELVSTTDVNYTLVGSTPFTTIQQQTITGIQFNQSLAVADVVRIEVGPATTEDMGYMSVPVRTTEDETQFGLDLVAGTQPVYTSLVKYKKAEQVKTVINQYPLFNVFDVCENEVVAATGLFEYKEDTSAALNPDIQRRLATIGSNYVFVNKLIEREDGKLYAYQDYALETPAKYWYSPMFGKVYFWTGYAWTTRVPVTITISPTQSYIKLFTPVVAPTAPANLATQEGALWLDNTTNTLYQLNSLFQWLPVSEGLVIEDINPLLRTVWKHGPINQPYVPRYIDRDYNSVPVGDPSGDWELPDQWYYNPEHKNRLEINYSQLITHFRSIVNEQPKIAGLLGGGAFSRTHEQYNYSLGGTIREYNDSYDTLISAVNVHNIVPPSLIEWAEDQYSTAQLLVKDSFSTNIVSLMTDLSVAPVVDFGKYGANKAIEALLFNGFLTTLYGDTTAYNPVTKQGVPNWIASLVMFGLVEKTRPHLNVDTKLNFVEVVHHDNHRNQILFSTAEYDSFAVQIINTPDTRVPGETFGKQSTLTPPPTEAMFVTYFGGTDVRPGVYWYRLDPNVRRLYRLNIIAATSIPPSFTYNGEELPDSVYYYNTSSNTLYIKQGLTWQVVTALGDGNISAAWIEIDFRVLLGQIFVDLERRLYEITPDYSDLVFDYGLLTNTFENTQTYNQLLEQQFFDFVVERNIRAPLQNTQYQNLLPFTWNYSTSVVTTPPTGAVTPQAAASWQETYTRWYGTPYPHLEPWKLQGYRDKPLWWDDEYLDTTGTRRWNYNHLTTTGMWENIRLGIIPLGYTAPDGTLGTGLSGQTTTYSYFSVNIDNAAVGVYGPDDLLPPYFNLTFPTLAPAGVRSLYDTLLLVSGTDADFRYGDGSYYEWLWKTSIENNYDQVLIAFLMEPVKLLHSGIGIKFATVDALQIDTQFCEVYSHEDALFHGDLYNINQVFMSNGFNQWYVNYNRYSGFDTNTEFRQLWKEWNPTLTYQLAGIADTSTFDIGNKYFDLVENDYKFLLVNNGVIRDLWSDAFKVSVLSIPPAIIQYNNQSSWRFDVTTLASVSRTINYYDVKVSNFQLEVENPGDPIALREYVGVAFRYNVIEASASSNRFYVSGNRTGLFNENSSFTVFNSTSNDGIYTVASSVYEPTFNKTRINTNESVLSSIGDGIIELNNVELPFETGTTIAITSTKTLPAPLLPNVVYYLIKLSPTTFKLAETFSDAQANVSLSIKSPGQGELTLGEIASTFVVFGGSSFSTETWYHYALNKTKVKTLSTPFAITSVQDIINVIDGYSAHQADVYLQQYNLSTGGEFDPDTGRSVNWQLELERFIDWAYRLRQARLSISDRFEFVVDNVVTDEFRFPTIVPAWATGEPVVISSTGILPTPLVPNTPYYFAPTSTSNIFKLSYSRNTTVITSIVDVSTLGSGMLYISRYNPRADLPTFEINPTRNNMWIDTPQGIVSNMVQGPYSDIKQRQTIFDQYGRPLPATSLNFYRQDLQTRINIIPQLANDVEPQSAIADPYNYLHIGGAHMFIEGYEHFLLFNDYSTGGALIYDSFLGLNVQRFDVDYFETADYTLRPTLGGHYLLDNRFYRNIEGSTIDLQNYYDVFGISENTPVAKRARQLLGYGGNVNYLDLLNTNSKTQFLFYRGMVQYKGSTNSVKAYINSRRFVDAKVDEFWAWKVADFGDDRPRVYPEIKLFGEDAERNTLRLMFLGNTEDEDTPGVADALEDGFEIVKINDETRWQEYPEQRQLLNNSALFLDAEVSSMTRIYTTETETPPPIVSQRHLFDYWFVKQYSSVPVSNIEIVLMAAGGVPYNTIVLLGDQSVITQPGSTILVTGTGTLNDGQIYTVGAPPTVTYYGFDLVTSIPVNNITPMVFVLPPAPPTALVTVAASPIPLLFKWTGENSGTHLIDWEPVSKTTWRTDGLNVWIKFDPLFDDVRVIRRNLDTPGDLRSYTNEILLEGTGVDQYEIINSRVVRFDLVGFKDLINVFTINPGYSKINPAKIVDTKAKVTISDAPMWDPARGQHYHLAIHNVDLQVATDPAKYTSTLNPNNIANDFWNYTERNKTWLDTSTLTYIPYYDKRLVPDLNERINSWGKLSDWGSVNMYQWVESPVAPDQYDGLVQQQSNNLLIPQQDKFTGTPRKTSFKRMRTPQSSVSITSGKVTITFTTTKNITDVTGLASFGTYNITLTIDGVYKAVTFNAAIIPLGTFEGVINAMNTAFPEAVCALSGNTITITSKTSGETSTVVVTADTMFVNMTDYSSTSSTAGTGFNATFDTIVMSGGTGMFTSGQAVYVRPSLTGNVLPPPLTEGVKYYVYNITPTTIQLTEQPNDIAFLVDLQSAAGSGFISVVPAFESTDWIRKPVINETFYPVIDLQDITGLGSNPPIPPTPRMITYIEDIGAGPVIKTQIYLNPSLGWAANDEWEVYVNGKLFFAQQGLGVTGLFGNPPLFVAVDGSFNSEDIVDVVRPLHELTQDEIDFDPDTEDDGTIHMQWKEDYEYSTATIIRQDGNDSLRWYFWAEGVINERNPFDRTSISIAAAQQTLQTLPIPYITLAEPRDDQYLIERFGWGVSLWGVNYSLSTLSDDVALIPVFYRQVVLNKAADYIIDGDRFVLQFTRDLSIRDNLVDNFRSNNLKNKHEEWLLIRQFQQNNIDKILWNKMVECVIGYKLNDPTRRVPSLEHELYDTAQGTQTRFGLGEGQAFTDGKLALDTIISYLQDPTVNFYPADINVFFENYSFDTPQNIQIALEAIYNTFGAVHVNAIWFNVLHDALSTKSKYKELMKTSWIAIYGVRVLEAGGLFDE